MVEVLESRVLLSNITWTGDADGTNWTNPGNWSSDAVPGSTDVVTINVPGNVTIQIASGAQDSVLSLNEQ